MKNISFFHTQRQFRTRTKFVTRRLGWENCVAGDRLNGIVKGQGLKKGEQVERMGEIIALNVRREPLFLVDKSEVILEGFPQYSPEEFIEFFCKEMKTNREVEPTRIEYGYRLGDHSLMFAEKVDEKSWIHLGLVTLTEKDVTDLQKINWLAKADYRKKNFCYQIKDILLTFFSKHDGYDLHTFDKRIFYDGEPCGYSYHSHILERRKIEFKNLEKPFIFHRPTNEFKYEVDNDWTIETRNISQNFEKYRRKCKSSMQDIKEAPEDFDKVEAVKALRRLVHKFKYLLRKQIEKPKRAKYPFMQIRYWSNGKFDEFTIRIPGEVTCGCGAKLIIRISNYDLAKIKLGKFSFKRDWQLDCNGDKYTHLSCIEKVRRQQRNYGNSRFASYKPYLEEFAKAEKWATEFFTEHWDEIVAPLKGIDEAIAETRLERDLEVSGGGF